jgi:hypothetical protein
MQAAEEFLKEKDDYGNLSVYANETAIIMIEFAKLNVEAALKEADIKGSEYMSGGADYDEYQESVLNSYPLTNIK